MSSNNRGKIIVSAKLALFSLFNFLSFSMYALGNFLSNAQLLSLISAVIYSLEPFALILLNKTILNGLKLIFRFKNQNNSI